MTSRRTFLASSLASTAPLASGAAVRPNVLILLADDLGWADVGYHHSEIRTPNIDRLAREGVRLERMHSFPVCSPTRSALMTGRSPMRFGCAYFVIRPWLKYGVPLEEHFMAESFKAAGYQTGITGKWHLGHSRVRFMPNSRGFDHAYGHVNGAIDYFTHVRDGGLDWHRNGKSVREEGYSTNLLAREACNFITRRDKTRPFFLYVPFNAPHTPLQAPEEWISRYPEIADKNRRTFAGMVSCMDAGAGRILETLSKEGIADNTIVLFFSDNGGPVAQSARNTPLRGVKGTTYEGGLRVPAIVRWPGRLKAGSSSEQVMACLDVFPTLAAAAGVKPLNKLPFDGEDLWPSIQGGTVRRRNDLMFCIRGQENRTMLAIRHGDWKLVRTITKDSVTTELFRPGEDPEEKVDLAAKNSPLVKELVGQLDAWQALHPKEGTGPSDAAPAGWKAPPQWAEAAAAG
jgi:arylsulfatase A-like enzyme